MNMVRAEYWRMIDNRQLPQKAWMTIALLESIDFALDDIHSPLNDYVDSVDARLFTDLAPEDTIEGRGRRDESKSTMCPPDYDDELERRMLKQKNFASTTAYPRTTSTPNPMSCCYVNGFLERDYERGFRNYETTYYVLRAVVVAHKRTQTNFCRVLCGEADVVPYNPEVCVVLLESAHEVEAAEQRINALSPILKSLVKTRIIADTVLNVQHIEIQRLIEDGVLNEADATVLSNEVHADSAKVRAARHRHTKTIARKAAEHERAVVRSLTSMRPDILSANIDDDDLHGGDLEGGVELSSGAVNGHTANIQRVSSAQSLLTMVTKY